MNLRSAFLREKPSSQTANFTPTFLTISQVQITSDGFDEVSIGSSNIVLSPAALRHVSHKSWVPRQTLPTPTPSGPLQGEQCPLPTRHPRCCTKLPNQSLQGPPDNLQVRGSSKPLGHPIRDSMSRSQAGKPLLPASWTSGSNLSFGPVSGWGGSEDLLQPIVLPPSRWPWAVYHGSSHDIIFCRASFFPRL